MAATATLVSGPTFAGPNQKTAVYQVLLDTNYAAGGEAIDLTGEFDFIYSGSIGGVDAIADAGYDFKLILPSSSTAVSSSNVLVAVHWSGTGAAVLAPFTTTGDLSSIGQLSITVVGA